MHIAIVGSTGRTGIHIVRDALERGFEVRALARTPAKMPLTHARLTVQQADVLHGELGMAIGDADAVIVALGGAQLKDTSTRSEGTRRILDALSKAHARRIVVISSAGAGDSFDQLSTDGQYIVKTVIKEAVEDHERQEELVAQSGLDWTILRPGGLTQDPLCAFTTDTTGTAHIDSIPRACVAKLSLDVLEDPNAVGRVYTLARAKS